jgi:hypothetical protein
MSARELRSDAKRKRDAGVATTSTPALPFKSQKKDTPTRYECHTCGENKTEKQFPDFNPSAECEHSIHICKACLRQWVDTCIESNQTTIGGDDGKTLGIQCPECPSLMRAVNIQIATIKKMYEQFDKLERKHIGDTTPGWRWCLSAYCNAGRVHETAEKEKAKNKKTKERDGSTYDSAIYLNGYEYEVAPNICTCHACGARACVRCDRPYHAGKTCKAYQLRTKDRMEEEDQAIRAIERATKPCPNCRVRIQKKGDVLICIVSEPYLMRGE